MTESKLKEPTSVLPLFEKETTRNIVYVTTDYICYLLFSFSYFYNKFQYNQFVTDNFDGLVCYRKVSKISVRARNAARYVSFFFSKFFFQLARNARVYEFRF